MTKYQVYLSYKRRYLVGSPASWKCVLRTVSTRLKRPEPETCH
jgi:hypothetical protein